MNAAIIFLAWGDAYLNEVKQCIHRSPKLAAYDKILITDQSSDTSQLKSLFTEIIEYPFELNGLLRKSEMMDALPDGYDAYLFLDSDTIVIEPIDFGFQKVINFGIALSPAPHYSLDYFGNFKDIMLSEKASLEGQMHYNSGVIFFTKRDDVKAVFKHWFELCKRYQDKEDNDQPFFSLAMEQLNFNPYTLSISYNYRGFGDAISGIVRVWHSHSRMPEGINEIKDVWPPRRAWPGKVEHYQKRRKLKHIFKRFKH